MYNGAGSCVACHMPDGKGQKGTIPPLAGSDWLKGGSARSIAISLRGLAGPIKVNGKHFYSAMPPQLLFDDEKLAYILSYVNNAWGNKEAIIDKEQVAQARKELPQDVFTPETLLKRFPFDKKYSRKNGTFTPTFDDMVSQITEPISIAPLCRVHPLPPSQSPSPETITSAGTPVNAVSVMSGPKGALSEPIKTTGRATESLWPSSTVCPTTVPAPLN